MPNPSVPSVHTHASEVDVRSHPGSKRNWQSRQSRWKGLSLQLKATLLAIAISTLPVLGIGTTADVVVSRLNQQEIEKSEQRLATEVQNHLNQYMWERFGDIQIMANQDIFTAPDRRQNTNDVQTNPATCALVARQLVSPDTQLLVSVPIQIAARIVGFIQCEEVRISQTWRSDEQTFVASIANLISIVLESEFLQQEVSHLLDVVSTVEQGDLTTQAQVSDRITGLVADTLNRFIERLAEVLDQVLTVAHQVSQGAYQQTELAETVATNAEQQAQAVRQVLSLTEQVENAAQASAQRATTSNESLQTVSTTLMQGQEAINALTQGITVLQEGTNRIMQRIKTLGEFAGLADQFVHNQSQIAFSTQTLSLNASLVAARASQQRDPRQFVVVAREFDSIADQVSKLAQQTSEGLTSLEGQSAQIYSVVSAVDGDVQSLGELVRQFTTGVEQSNQVFNHVQIVTGEAMQAGEAVEHFNQEIVEAAQITATVMQDIAGLANKTAELTQMARKRSEQMELLSAQLLQTVQFFQFPSAIRDGHEDQAGSHNTQAEEITLTVPVREVPSSQILQA